MRSGGLHFKATVLSETSSTVKCVGSLGGAIGKYVEVNSGKQQYDCENLKAIEGVISN